MSQAGRWDASAGSDTGHFDDPDDDSFTWTQFRHYLHAPLRRPVLVLVPWVVVVLLSIAALVVFPKKYMSSTLILVESEKVPESFIPKVATGDRSQRLEAVKPEILSRTRLERVLEETRPYPDIESKTQAVQRMRGAITINVSGNDGLNIEFVHSDPRKAQEVTDRLARLFIDETIKSREQQVEGAVDFLVTQVNDARKELENKDAALRRYKEAHMGELPEQLQTNLATMQMLQRELQTVEESLFFAREKQEAMARQVSRSSVGERPGISTPAVPTELVEMRRQLALLKARYKDAHPDVETLRSRIARLEARLTEAPASDEQTDADAANLVTRAQLDRANQEAKKLEDRQRALERRIASIRVNVEETPRTEQELATLMRDYQKLNENYVALLSKQLEAQMSGRLEQRWKGERFRMLDPASLPEKPVFPKPPVFLGLGAVLGLFVGLGAALVAEFLDPTVKDTESLQAVQSHPVLACIPHHPGFGGSSTLRLMKLDGAALRNQAGHRDAAAEPWGAQLAGEVGFRNDGIFTRTNVVPFVESLRDHNSIAGEELRLLSSNLLELCRRRKASCLAVASALPGEGKTTVTLGLAAALAAEPGRRILLVEADLRRPSLTAVLGLPPAPGLSEWLNGTLDHVPVRRIEPGGFFVLAAGQAVLNRREELGSPRMDALLRAARGLFDFVLLDAVPVLPVADTVLMQDLVDGFVLVVRSRRTPREAIRVAVAKLRSDRVMGLVLNDHHEYRGSYNDHAFRKYGMGYGSPSSPRQAARLAPGVVPRSAAGRASTEAPAGSGLAVPSAHHQHLARKPAADLALRHEESPEARSRKLLIVVALAILLLAAAAGGYMVVRDPNAPAAAATVEPASTTLSPDMAVALARVKVLEERLQSLEAEKAAAVTQAAAEARIKVEAHAAARGRTADAGVIARVQEEARRRVQADQEQRLREEQERLRAEQRAAEEQLAEQRRREEERLATAAASTNTTTTTTALPPPITAPPVPAVTAGTMVSLSDPGVIAPVLERASPPTYPPVALRQGREGTVLLNVLVDETGNVTDTQILSGVGGRSGLNDAAVNSVKGRSYRPATKDGVPVKVWLPVRVQFRLP